MTDHPPILTPEQVAKVRVCAHLIEPPAARVVGELADSHEALRQRAAEDAATIARLTREIEALKKPAQTHCGSCTDPQCWGTRQPALLRAEQAEAALATLREATTWQLQVDRTTFRWTCSCGNEFDSKEAFVAHLRQAHSLPPPPEDQEPR